MPAPLSGSLQLTKPNSLSRFRDPPLSSRRASSRSDDFEADSSSDYNSVLKSRHSLASTTSLKSVIASREHQHKEEPHHAAPPTVGKDKEGSGVSGVTFRPRSSLHGNPGDVTSRRANRSSWSPQTNTTETDPHFPKMIFTSSSLHHSDRSGSHSHSSNSSSPRHSAHLESTMKKFDDLLSDKHTFDSEEELPKVSNSVSLDLLKSRNAGRVAASMKASHEPTESPSTPASVPTSDSADEVESYKAAPAVASRNKEIAEPSQRGKVHAKAVGSIPAVDGSKQKEEAESACREDAGTLQSQSSPSKDSHKEETPSEAEVKEEKVAVMQQKPAESSPQNVKQRTKPTVRDDEEEDAGDAYPEADAPAGPPALDIQMTADSYPGQDTEAPPVDISASPASYPKEDAADDLAREMMFQQQASSIVQTVLANAASLLQQEEPQAEEEEDDDDDAPPPIPDEAPPPLPGAPPPPIIMRNNAERLVAPEDMEVLPSQDTRSAKSSPRSSEERTSSAEASPREVTRPTAAEHLELEVAEAVEAETIPANFTLPNEQDLTGKNTDSHKQEESQEPVNDADVMISFDSNPADSLPLSVDTDLLGGGLPGKDRYLENAHGENPPVSDTLSQDSGVQDEDMSEDGLRFSQDDSPTSHGDFSSAMITPDEIPVSILNGNDGKVNVDVVEHVVTKSSPVPSPRASPRVTLSQASSPTSLSLRDITVVTTQDTSVVSSPRASPRDNVQIVHASLTQVSASPRCSSDPQQTEASVPRGGASTTGDRGERKRDNSAANSAAVDNVGKDHVQSVAIDSNNDDKAVSRDRRRKDADRDTIAQPTTRNVSSPRSPSRSPRKSPSPEEEETSEQEDSFSTSDIAEIVSSRKWCILDQSGSMFLHGASNSTVSVTKAMIRQVSSLMPDDLVKAMEAGNKDLDAAKLPKTVELRMVSVRGLNGRPVSVDVTQREDYFVQVTKVHTKNCSVEEGDILMSVDGRSLRNRRPAQVHAQIEGTGPKGAMLTARGVKLPPSVVRQLEERSQDARPKTPDFDSTPTASSPTSSNPNSPTTAVEVSSGVYEVTMTKGVTGVGFCLEGGKASPKGDLPILIKRIFKGGPAEKCGQLKVKDEILAVNGVNFTVMRHYEAWNHLKFLDDGEIHLKIRRGES
ncbi:streptococcal hemagglutinin-like [Littorina saxatilis]